MVALSVFLLLVFFADSQPCGCKDQTHCSLPSSLNNTREELFAFISFSTSASDIQKILTLGLATSFGFYGIPSKFSPGDLSHWWDDLLCPSHAAGVHVVPLVGFSPISQLTNSTARVEWVKNQLKTATTLRYDGLNFDVEATITDRTIAKGYTSLVQEAADAFRSVIPKAQISLDTPYAPGCTWERCYEYPELSKICDFLFLMDYDMASKESPFEPPIATSNDGIKDIERGLNEFLLFAEPNKLVMGFPWYGYNYPCHSPTAKYDCPVDKSRSGAGQLPYSVIAQLIEHNMTDVKVLWNDVLKSPYFNFIDSETKVHHQVWFDNVESLGVRVELARSKGIRGVGMWQANCPDYGIEEQWKGLWEALGKFLKKE